MGKIAPSAQPTAQKLQPSIALPRGNYYGLLAGYSNVWQRGKYQNQNEKVDVITLGFLVTHDPTGAILPHFARASKIVENKVTYWAKQNTASALANFYSVLQGMDAQSLVAAVDAGGEEYIPNLDNFIAYPVALTLDMKVSTAKPEDGGYAYETNSIKDIMPAPAAFIQQISQALQEGQLTVAQSNDGRCYLKDPKHAKLEYVIQNNRVVDVIAPTPEHGQRALEVIRLNTPAVLAIGQPMQAAPAATGTFGAPARGFGAPAAQAAPAAPAAHNGFGGGQVPAPRVFGAPANAQPAAPAQAPSNVHAFPQPNAAAPTTQGATGFAFGNRPAPAATTAAPGGQSPYEWREIDDEVPF